MINRNMLKRAGATGALCLALAVLGAAPASAEEPMPAPTLDCPHNTVPGWLDDEGNPTSCVGDAPCPETETGDCPEVAATPAPIVAPVIVPEVVPVDVPVVEPAPTLVLAETGPDAWTLAGLLAAAAALFTAGITLVRKFS